MNSLCEICVSSERISVFFLIKLIFYLLSVIEEIKDMQNKGSVYRQIRKKLFYSLLEILLDDWNILKPEF